MALLYLSFGTLLSCCYSHDKVRLQKLKERKQGKQEDKLEKEMSIGNNNILRSAHSM